MQQQVTPPLPLSSSSTSFPIYKPSKWLLLPRNHEIPLSLAAADGGRSKRIGKIKKNPTRFKSAHRAIWQKNIQKKFDPELSSCLISFFLLSFLMDVSDPIFPCFRFPFPPGDKKQDWIWQEKKSKRSKNGTRLMFTLFTIKWGYLLLTEGPANLWCLYYTIIRSELILIFFRH